MAKKFDILQIKWNTLLEILGFLGKASPISRQSCALFVCLMIDNMKYS